MFERHVLKGSANADTFFLAPSHGHVRARSQGFEVVLPSVRLNTKPQHDVCGTSLRCHVSSTNIAKGA